MERSSEKQEIEIVCDSVEPLIFILKSLSLPRMICEGTHFDVETAHTFIIFGASGDLAKKKIYPALWYLYRDHLLPTPIIIIGYSRTKLTVPAIKLNCKEYIQVKTDQLDRYERFWQCHDCVAGSYESREGFEILAQRLKCLEKKRPVNRIFYLALPPSVFTTVTIYIKELCLTDDGFNRIIIEKPFGRDAATSQLLSDHIAKMFHETEIYRIDHYLGKEMVQNLMTIRFANKILSATWNREHIASVLITFKEPFGTEGRCGYFDEYGIIRDVMQNHLLQILCLIAMEKPVSCHPDHIRDEKVKVLKCIKPIQLENILIGQYVGDKTRNRNDIKSQGYRDDCSLLNKKSNTATYALAVLRIDNERWQDIPFILRCGKAVNERKAEVRIQYQDVPGDIFEGQSKRNEFVIRVQPGEAVYFKMMTKSPGITFDMIETELDLTYAKRYKDSYLPDAYERLLLDVFCGSQMHFVRSDELHEAWRIFTPVLHRIENENIEPLPYLYGSRGPQQVDTILQQNNFKYYGSYKWASQ